MRTSLTPVAIALAAFATQALAQTPDWVEDFPTPDPTPRAGLQGTSDGSKLYLYGGNSGPGVPYYNSLWSYDGTAWVEEHDGTGTAPSGRVNYGLAWDEARNVLVLFGGRNNVTGDMGDTWEWTSVGGWTQVALTGTTPGPRRWHQLDYFPGLGVLLHAGKDVSGTGTVYDDTWAWNGTAWTQLANGPYKRQRGRMVYRGAPHSDILWYGGRDEFNGGLDETWSFDGTTWSQIVTTSAPYSPGVWAFGMYYDSVRDRVVFFGGSQGGVEKNQTWEFDNTNWAQVLPATNPGIRSGMAIAWVSGAAEAYMYGGFSGSQKDDTWRRGTSTIPGSFTVSGTGCAGSTGAVAALSAPSPPKIGQALVVDMTNTTPLALPVAIFGVSNTSWVLGSLPYALSGLFPASPVGCDLLVSVDLTQNMTITGPSSASVALPIPNKPALAGQSFYVQGLQVELLLPSGDLSLVTSAYGTALIGN